METFKYRINTFVYSARKTMAEIIDICRKKAFEGHSVTLEIMGENGWVKMGHYGPNTESPMKVSYQKYVPFSDRGGVLHFGGPVITEEIECYISTPAPLAFEH